MNLPLPPRWVRRLIIDPLWVPAALALAAVFALVAGVAALLSRPASRVASLTRLAPRRRVWRLTAFAATYLVVDVAALLACTGFWLRFPVRRRHPVARQRWQAQHAAVLRWALRSVLRAGEICFGFAVHIDEPATGNGLTVSCPVVILARHAGPGDSLAIAHLVMERYRLVPRIVLKDTLQLDPGLDVLLNRLACCFLPAHADPDRADDAGGPRQRVGAVASGLGPSDAVLLFPEGGNWTPRRQRRAIRRLWRTGRRRAARQAELRPHLLPPRSGGVLACLAACPGATVIVIAHTGLETVITARDAWRAIPLHDRPMRLTWWAQPVATLPIDEPGRVRWLEAQWSLVEQWIARSRA